MSLGSLSDPETQDLFAEGGFLRFFQINRNLLIVTVFSSIDSVVLLQSYGFIVLSFKTAKAKVGIKY